MYIFPNTQDDANMTNNGINKVINIRNLVSADVQLTTGKKLIEEDDISEPEEIE